MPCLTMPQLEQLAVGDDGVDDESRVHLAACPDCSRRLAEIAENISFVDRLRDGVGLNGHPKTGDLIGGYEVVREIGRGGMGVVYEARQQSPPRSVALKVLRHPAADERHVRLFRREAEVLARVQHPAVAAIHEAGCTDSGHWFFAMELVEGRPLLQYANDRELSLTQRLRLFVQVCDAITAAHQRGVIHRDIKPSNLMVRSDGTPKVLDFGLARVLEIDDGRASVSELSGTHVFGTIPYMSPEHTHGGTGSVDIRSDVYSLGVVLYELLTGRLPYDLDRRNLAGAVRAICEQPPKRPGSLRRELRGDLETILLTALEKSPDRRYQSASALRADVDRYLNHQPISARRPTLGYVLGRLLVRHKVAGALVIAILALTVLFGVVAGALAVRLNLQRQAAVEARDDAEARLAEALDQADYLMNTVVTALGLAGNSDEMRYSIARDMHELLAGLARRYPDHIDVQFRYWESLRLLAGQLAGRGEPDDARALMLESHALVVKAADAHPERRDIRFQLAYSSRHLAQYRRADEAEAAAELLELSVALLRQLAEEAPTEPLYRRELAASLGHAALGHRARGDTDRAVACLLEAETQFVRACALEPENPRRFVGLASIRHRLATLADADGRTREARRLFTAALEAIDSALTLDPEHRWGRERGAQVDMSLARLEAGARNIDQARRHALRAVASYRGLASADPDSEARRADLERAERLVAELAAPHESSPGP